jgi:putative N6-adenine-specific DNA methylase
MVERLKDKYHVSWFLEDGASYPLRVFIMKDMVTIGLDSTGESLHKRGYRKLAAPAPIAENLAAGILLLTPWKDERPLVDPMCGSGTFPIEAAMMACGIAPGMHRSFAGEAWPGITGSRYWGDARQEAEVLVDLQVETDIQGYDIDEDMIEIARENARQAGVLDKIHFQRRALDELRHPRKYGFLVTNPPYGERMTPDHIARLYQSLGQRYRLLDTWSMYVITSYEQAEKDIGRKADKNRKIYNGMLKTYLYQYQGPKPPRRSSVPEHAASAT